MGIDEDSNPKSPKQGGAVYLCPSLSLSPTIPAMLEASGAVNNLAELIKRSTEASVAFKREDVWWRGQSDASWTLVAGVHRKNLGPIYERNISARFLLKAHTRHPHCPPEKDWPGWLFLMQHYRLPTRLLDWTTSALIAAFFAVTDSPNEDGALWALDPLALNENQVKTKSILLATGSSALPIFRAAFIEAQQQQSLTAAVLGREIDVRMLIQQSTFTIHGTANPIEALLGADNFLRKLIVPAASNATIKAQLNALGFKLHTLFPDLEHLAQDLAELRFQG